MRLVKLNHAFAAFAASVVLAGLGMSARSQSAPPGPPMDPLTAVLLSDALHTTLGLNTLQETQWQQLKSAAATTGDELRTSAQELHRLTEQELAKTNPNLYSIETQLETTRSSDDELTKALRLQSLAFYSALNSSQQALVLVALRQLPRPRGGPAPA